MYSETSGMAYKHGSIPIIQVFVHCKITEVFENNIQKIESNDDDKKVR